MGDKMKRTMALALSVFATFLVIAMQPANAQTEGSEYELAVKKALAELKKVPADMAVLETSNKKFIEIRSGSNRNQQDAR